MNCEFELKPYQWILKSECILPHLTAITRDRMISIIRPDFEMSLIRSTIVVRAI